MRRWLTLSSILVCSWLVASVAEPGAKTKPALKLSADEQKLVDLTNFERKQMELPPLKVQVTLMRLARAHSENMAKQEKLDHELDGKSPFVRMKEANYDYLRAGENIATSAGNPAMADILKMWMDSPGHRAQILSEDFTEIGVGIARNDKGELYCTQVFAAPFEK